MSRFAAVLALLAACALALAAPAAAQVDKVANDVPINGSVEPSPALVTDEEYEEFYRQGKQPIQGHDKDGRYHAPGYYEPPKYAPWPHHKGEDKTDHEDKWSKPYPERPSWDGKHYDHKGGVGWGRYDEPKWHRPEVKVPYQSGHHGKHHRRILEHLNRHD